MVDPYKGLGNKLSFVSSRPRTIHLKASVQGSLLMLKNITFRLSTDWCSQETFSRVAAVFIFKTCVSGDSVLSLSDLVILSSVVVMQDHVVYLCVCFYAWLMLQSLVFSLVNCFSNYYIEYNRFRTPALSTESTICQVKKAFHNGT